MRAIITKHKFAIAAIVIGGFLLAATMMSRNAGSAETSPSAPAAGEPISAPSTATITTDPDAADAAVASPAAEFVAETVDPDRLRLPLNPSGARDRRTEEGVRQAGIDFASTVQQRLVYLNNADGASVLRAWRADGLDDAAVAADIESVSVLRQSLEAGGGAVWWSVSPIGADVEVYTDDRARVSVWVMQVVGSSVDPIEGGTGFIPTVDFNTATIEFVWNATNGWTIFATTSTPGPVPMLAPSSVQSAPAVFFDSLEGHTLIQEHR